MNTAPMLTRRQAAERLGLSEQTLRHWARQNRGPEFRKVGRAVRYPLEAVLSFLICGESASDEPAWIENITAAVKAATAGQPAKRREAVAKHLRELARHI